MAGDIEIELELEPDDADHAGARPPAPAPDAVARRWWQQRTVRGLVALGVVGAIALGATVTGGGSGTGASTTATVGPPSTGSTTIIAASGTASGTASSASSAVATPAIGTTATAGVPALGDTGDGPFRVGDTGQLERVDVGHPLLASPTGLRLVARLTDGRLVRVDVDAGTATFVPQAEAPIDGAVLLAAGPDWTVVRPTGRGTGYLLRDDGTVVPLDGLLAGPVAAVYPSDRPDQLWVVVDGLKPTTGYVQLVDLVGATVGTSSLPLNGVRPIGPDGAGGVLVATTGGVYRADRAGYELITTGVVLATSPAHLAVLECDAALTCRRILVDRATGDRVPLGPAPPGPVLPALAAVAPGGTRVAVRTPNAAGIDLIDVATGTLTEIDASPRALAPPDAGPVVWSDDGRFLVYLDRHTDHLVAFDTTTASASDLTPGLPPVSAWVERSR